MLIKIGYDIQLRPKSPTAIIFLLRVHPSRRVDLVADERFCAEPDVLVEDYIDSFGNHCGRVCVRDSSIRFKNEALIRDSGDPDAYVPEAQQYEVCDIPLDTLLFLLPSRYCEVDSELLDFAWKTFAGTLPGGPRVQAVCDFVHGHIRFNYQQARANRTALDAFRERVGVCRDFTYLAVTLCRCLNIPARYVTGYLGDIGVLPLNFERALIIRTCHN
jgi:transglutaminase-like putative cysteine protease